MGGGDRVKDDHNTGGKPSKGGWEGRGRDVWHGKGLEADTHSMDAPVGCADDDAALE